MESYINIETPPVTEEGVEYVAKKVLIATIYNAEPVLLASTRLGPDILILLVDEEPNKEQNEAIKTIQTSIGKVLEVKLVKTDVYDIVKVARKCVEIIDMQHKDDIIYVNITSGRKTKAIGLLFAAYARHEKVAKIAYNPEEDKTSVVYLPRLSFNLTESQKTILELLDKGKYDSITDLAAKLETAKIDLSTAMLYRAINELKDFDFVEVDATGIRLTDAGKIARL